VRQLFYLGQQLRDQRLRVSIEPELFKKNQKVRHLCRAYPGRTRSAASFAARPGKKRALSDVRQCQQRLELTMKPKLIAKVSQLIVVIPTLAYAF
jgi:hypothetical protein